VGYRAVEEAVDVVTISHDHADHNYIQGLRGNPKVVTGVGSREEAGISFQGIASFHDKRQGKDRGVNTIFRWEMDGLAICHLGDLGHSLSSDHRAEIGRVDILLVPVGGFFTIDAQEAAALVDELNPSLVIPMHFKTEVLGFPVAKVEDFTRMMKKVRFLETCEVEVSKESLPTEMEVWVLRHAC
jgi:L-ascorbate metabolism protein UlaG (beta-lactamase superfamily)